MTIHALRTILKSFSVLAYSTNDVCASTRRILLNAGMLPMARNSARMKFCFSETC
jgi:hypothetical protein